MTAFIEAFPQTNFMHCNFVSMVEKLSNFNQLLVQIQRKKNYTTNIKESLNRLYQGVPYRCFYKKNNQSKCYMERYTVVEEIN